MPAGRPPMYATTEEIESAIEGYFKYIQGEERDVEVEVKNSKTGETSKESYKEWVRKPEPETITGLAYFLGFASRQSFYDYEKESEFSYAIKRARLRIEISYEKELRERFPTGSIFALKNLGWEDRAQVAHEGLPSGPVQIEIVEPKNEDE